jgi:hypothetical protein
MIVVLDTNALWGDVYAAKQWAETLFATAAQRDDLEVWVPSVVVEELVRQFPDRMRELEGAGKKLRNDAFALGWNLPPLPETDTRIAEYRGRLEDRLRSPAIRIAPPPERARTDRGVGRPAPTANSRRWVTSVEHAFPN